MTKNQLINQKNIKEQQLTQNTMPPIKKTKYQKINIAGLPINADIRYVGGHPDGKVPLVLIAHGFKGYKDWGFFPYISERISEAGFITACFNFSLNGMNDSVDLIDDMDRFERWKEIEAIGLDVPWDMSGE